MHRWSGSARQFSVPASQDRQITRGFVIAFPCFACWIGKSSALIRANSRFLVLRHCKLPSVPGDSYDSFRSAQNSSFLADCRPRCHDARIMQRRGRESCCAIHFPCAINGERRARKACGQGARASGYGRRCQVDGSRTAAGESPWQRRRTRNNRRICLDDVSPLRAFPRNDAAGTSEEVHRHRQGASRFSRVSVRPAC